LKHGLVGHENFQPPSPPTKRRDVGLSAYARIVDKTGEGLCNESILITFLYQSIDFP
jgi:hypothetical protein